MCAICGILEPVGKKVDQNTLLRMRDAMFHRGPDAGGHYVHESVGLGHRRLKIIDLSEAGHQPMANEDGTITVVFNGEIYNFKELREELQAKGHRFRSRSDTEVIVHGYEEWGESCVERFNGMFAFAAYDRRRRELFLARDRLGIKPLYYWTDPHAFIFASEIKAFLAFERFQACLNKEALPEYLLFRSLAGDSTLFGGVKTLLPGHWIRVRSDLSIQIRRYWDLPLHCHENGRILTPGDDSILGLLKESVALQEMSDVPLGVQLSGGTDSSLVTALMAERSTHSVKTFTVGFDEKEFSELPYAQIVANHLRTEHHEIILRNKDFSDALATLTWHSDEPLTHPNSAGVFWLCRDAKPSATVLLTGEGSDEVFAGYHRYQRLLKILLLKRSAGPLPFSRALKSSLSDLIVRSNAHGFQLFNRYLHPTDLGRVQNLRTDILAPVFERDWLTQALYYDVKTYLVPILMRQDKMGMAHGVETRVPFLDHRLVESAFRLPSEEKLSWGKGKVIIKRLAARYLPPEILFRPKAGFSFPIEAWLRSRDGLGELVTLLGEGKSLSRQLFPRPLLSRMIEEHQQGKANHFDNLWTLLALEVWYRRFFPSGLSKTDVSGLEFKREEVEKPVVAHIVQNLKTGGLERVVANLVERSLNSSFKHIVCCLEERGNFATHLGNSDFPVYCFRKREGIDWNVIRELSKFLKDYRVRVVHTHNPGPHLYGLVASKLGGVRACVNTRHGQNYPNDKKKVWTNRVLSWMTDTMVPVSEDAGKVMSEVEHIHGGKIKRIWNGVDVEKFHPGIRRNPSSQVIGTASRLSSEKDHGTMMEAFRLVLEKLPAARLAIVGDGPCAQSLHELVQELDIASKVDFLGERFDIPNILQSFTLFSLSSITEGLSMTILEAMATDLPIIATDVGGNRELVNPPECGLLVPPHDPAALAEAFLQVLQDEGLQRKMGQAARERVMNHFSLDQMASQYERLYQDLIMKEGGRKK